ncbi:MAG: hypothetical protein WC788_06690 [Candidatus Paceibacterota bacterium]|jgi:hypothetical protein
MIVNQEEIDKIKEEIKIFENEIECPECGGKQKVINERYLVCHDKITPSGTIRRISMFRSHMKCSCTKIYFISAEINDSIIEELEDSYALNML